MSAVDFGAWAEPDLVLELGGRTFRVPPPSVEDAKKVIAAAVRAEVNLGLVQGEIPVEIQSVLDTIGPDDHPALGPVFHELKETRGVSRVTLDRMAYYAVFYWARGKEYADTIAQILWTPRDVGEQEAGEAPKA